MKIWHISDTHSFHEQLTVPKGIDLVIHSGDATNYHNKYNNLAEMNKFLEWYGALDVPHKIYVAGNHDAAISEGLITKSDFASRGITYLENSGVSIPLSRGKDVYQLKIWGSPYTPTFGGWYFMKDRQDMHTVWDKVPADTDILVTHGPPKRILDLAGYEEHCGCQSLANACNSIDPYFVMFGHIHNNGRYANFGYKGPFEGKKTIYSNASVMTDNRFNYGPTSNGHVFDFMPEK